MTLKERMCFSVKDDGLSRYLCGLCFLPNFGDLSAMAYGWIRNSYKAQNTKRKNLKFQWFWEQAFQTSYSHLPDFVKGRDFLNKKTIALTTDQYKEIIRTMREGFSGCKPNNRIATALMIEANLGLRISDVLALRLSDIIQDGDRYRLSIVEKKTGKARMFTVPLVLYQFIRCYCLDNQIGADEIIFPITERAVQRQLKLVCDYLDITGVSTHSFRKYYATEIYKNNGYNIALVQQLLQHSSTAVTQRYIGIQQKEVEAAIENHLCLNI